MTSINSKRLQALTLDQVLTSHPLTVSPTMTIAEVVAQMGQAAIAIHRQSCALVIEQGQLCGIFTKHDLVRLVADGVDLERMAIAQGMTHPVQTLPYTETYNLFSILATLKQHQVGQLPILDSHGQVLGIVTQTTLFGLLEQIDPVGMAEEIDRLQQLSQAQTLKLKNAHQDQQKTREKLQTSLIEQERLETILLQANRHLEERMGIQAAQIIQIDEELQSEIQERYQAQGQLKQFFTLAPSLMCIAGIDGYFKQINSRFPELLGYDEAKLLTTPFLDFVHPDDQAATVLEVERLSKGEATIAFLNRYRCKDGQYRWFSWNAMANPEKQIIYAVANDVTAQRRNEQTLAHQYQQQQLLAAVTRNIRDSLDLGDILITTATGVQELLECDRVLIIQIESDTTGQVIQEAMNPQRPGPSLLHEVVTDLTIINEPEPSPPYTCVFDIPDIPCALQ
ncbi:CBS domain-containing protein, partial [Okeania sp. SIO2G5]|uniref:CBS domain-containing protein n=1 Tax=Okeania sp. SIO2G5 TaxID=2607796 RepID=UPI0013C0278E